jgi:uncharacterized membrane protein YeaQ/YmgE (transglycosylase-associated protein family)
MKFSAIKGIVGGLAPTLGATLGGPLGATAGKVLAEVLGCDPSAKAIDDRLRQATPEDLVAIKEAELKYAAKMEELGVDMFELETIDKQDARRHFAGDWTARAIGILSILGFIAYIFTVTIMPPTANSETIGSLVLGYMGGMVSAVISFYFGASQAQSNPTEDK